MHVYTLLICLYILKDNVENYVLWYLSSISQSIIYKSINQSIIYPYLSIYLELKKPFLNLTPNLEAT